MNGNDLISFMDLLAINEEVVDEQLDTIIKNSKHSVKNLTFCTYLLRYKKLIYEDDECANDEEFEFIVKLISQVSEENIDKIYEIVNKVLDLDKDTLQANAEHLLQQLLPDIFEKEERKESVQEEDVDNEYINSVGAGGDNSKNNEVMSVPSEAVDKEIHAEDTHHSNKIFHILKVCDSILCALLKNNCPISLGFLETPIEEVLDVNSEIVTTYFLLNIVPKFVGVIEGYKILDRIWDYIIKIKYQNNEKALKILSSLADYYLPVPDKQGKSAFKSDVVKRLDFWQTILCGLQGGVTSRKTALYLAKRSMECLKVIGQDLKLKSENGSTVFDWKNGETTQIIWANFFTLFESLEEKQSNIVLPSLQLFEEIGGIGAVWLDCLFILGLSHENTEVKRKCLEYRLDSLENDEAQIKVMLSAMNDSNLYNLSSETKNILDKLKDKIDHHDKLFLNMLNCIPEILWSPVALYHIIGTIDNQPFDVKIINNNEENICEAICNINKMPCNIPIIKKHVQVQILKWICKMKNIIKIKYFIAMMSSVNFSLLKEVDNAMMSQYLEGLAFRNNDEDIFFNFLTSSPVFIKLAILFLENASETHMNTFLDKIKNKIDNIQDITSRQYSDKTSCLGDFLYVAEIYFDTIATPNNHNNICSESINLIIRKEKVCMIQYISSLLVEDTELDHDELTSFLNCCAHLCKFLFVVDDLKENLLVLYKVAVTVLQGSRNIELRRRLIGINIVNFLIDNNVMKTYYPQEMLDVNMNSILKDLEDDSKIVNDDNGRLRSCYYSANCEIVEYFITTNINGCRENIHELLKFVDNVLECGGYDSLNRIIRIMILLLPIIIERNVQYDLKRFIERVWNEIEGVKSNKQYQKCIYGFISLIMNEAMLKTTTYNNLILFYFMKILEYGAVSVMPLYYFVEVLKEKDITVEQGQLIYILHEVLLFAPVLRKDQRIVEKITAEILNRKELKIVLRTPKDVQSSAVGVLQKNPNIYDSIVTLIKKRIDELFKNKRRYHGDSQPHLTLFRALQHILYIGVCHTDSHSTIDWCVQLLSKLPHQTSVKTCLEIIIAKYCWLQFKLNAKEKECWNFEKIPHTSQFLLQNYVMCTKIFEGYKISNEDIELVMNDLLPHIMGPQFNIRLYAQYIAVKLQDMFNMIPERLISKGVGDGLQDKYAYTINLIRENFEQSSTEKTYKKLREDYFINDFNLMKVDKDFIYEFLPNYFNIGGIGIVDENAAIADDENVETNSVTIQKKFIPWRHMSDVELGVKNKTENASELIVVASLIDKLPNLGGMVRTSEVFGVKTYVVNSKKHLQDKQFQGLSVSAERWVDIEEVHPGKPLKDYLMMMKSDGYSVVAAEQTSNSVLLQNFKFPKKTVLVLGHEKLGVPCDLLPYMDHCVEIPQQGVVRSLNVHVTAAIFVWEYTQQNIL